MLCSFAALVRSGGDNKGNMLPAASPGSRCTVPDAAVAPSCTWHSVSCGFRFLNSVFFNALAAASNNCVHASIFLLNALRDYRIKLVNATL